MAKKKKPEKLRGARRMKEQGYKLVNVWLSPDELAVIERAAKLVERKLATFVREAAFGSAGVVLGAEKSGLGADSAMWRRMIKWGAPPTL